MYCQLPNSLLFILDTPGCNAISSGIIYWYSPCFICQRQLTNFQLSVLDTRLNFVTHICVGDVYAMSRSILNDCPTKSVKDAFQIKNVDIKFGAHDAFLQ
jgi:hypothetical protein